MAVESRAAASSYGPFDRERWFPEEHSNRRSDFARDRARLFHSSALRRLAAKTQVLSPTVGLDFARTRLTHSLEVAQIGRELATNLGLNPDVVDTACLAHDLGHPPFGHNGELALSEWSADIGGFEGNAQTLRVITRLEPKVFGPDRHPYGLNLTRASLDASCKYPWPIQHAVADPSGREKFGFYAEDTAVFEWLRDGAPERVRCIEAQVMDLSDDIAYSVHDFEDAVFNGYIDVAQLASPAAHDDIMTKVQAWVGTEFTRDELEAAYLRLTAMEPWIRSWDGSRLAQAQLKNLTSQLIGRFARTATTATRASYPRPSLARYAAQMIVPPEEGAEIGVMKGITAAFIMSNNERQPVYHRQRELLTGLADALLATGPAHLDPGFAEDWADAGTEAARKRVVVDQVASLTDQSAIAWFERLVQQ
ncbi:MAG TPA: deoxyguanosinetriphosphate triphosphohydrolase [Gryllotalpicola sp.]